MGEFLDYLHQLNEHDKSFAIHRLSRDTKLILELPNGDRLNGTVLYDGANDYLLFKVNLTPL
jgi:hypothetical protein